MQLESMFRQNRKNGMVKVNVKIFMMIMTLSVFGLVLAGCNGGGSGSDSYSESDTTSANIMTGVFVDSPVAGVNYQTETHEGITDADGHFTCFDGEMVVFMIGDVVLGQATANEMITLMDFLDSNAMPHDITNPMVVNMGRFLQSLDADGDPENGITITPAMRDEITGRMIDFHQSVEDFANDPDVLACFDTLNGLNMPHNGMMWGLVSSDDALAHMAEHMGSGAVTEDEGTGGDSMGNSDMTDPMGDSANNSMGHTDADGAFDMPMDEYMPDGMEDYMDDHMGLSDDDEDGGFDMPMDDFMDGEMIDYVNDHMGYTTSDGLTTMPMWDTEGSTDIIPGTGAPGSPRAGMMTGTMGSHM